MRPALLAAAILALSPVAAPAAVRPGPVLQQMLADSAKAPVVAFERTARAELRADPDKEPAVVIDRFVPRDGASGSWALVSIDGRPPTADETRRHRRANADGPVPGFHRLHKVLGGTPEHRTEAEGRIVYRWNSLPAGAVLTPGGDISASLSAEATIEEVGGKPLISKVRIFAAAPFRIRGIATMNHFEVISHYRHGAAHPFLVAQTSATDVKAPFGIGGKRRNSFSFRPL